MWEWARAKIDKKLKIWNRWYLSLVGKFQVYQKILSSYKIYYSSAWLFNVQHFSQIQKVVRDFLWFDGKGELKRHVIKWKWCTMVKTKGGLGLKDLKIWGGKGLHFLPNRFLMPYMGMSHGKFWSGTIFPILYPNKIDLGRVSLCGIYSMGNLQFRQQDL